MNKKKKHMSMRTKRAIYGYVCILPFIIGFFAFLVKPLFNSLYMSFCNVLVSPQGFSYEFIGIENYRYAFLVDTQFNGYLTTEFSKMFINSIATMIFSFFVAVVLNQKFKGRAFVRAVFFLPVIVSSGVILGIETNNTLLAQVAENVETPNAFNSITGAIETILKTAGVGTKAFEQVFEIVDGIYDVAIASGIQIIIFLSGLQTISPSVYEAADIEGCTGWEKFWKITFPMVSSLFIVNWIYTIVDFSMRSDSDLMDKIRKELTVNINYGFSSAMSWVYFLLVAVIILLSSAIISKWVYYYE